MAFSYIDTSTQIYCPKHASQLNSPSPKRLNDDAQENVSKFFFLFLVDERPPVDIACTRVYELK